MSAVRGFGASRVTYAARRPTRSAQQLRADWVAAIMLAGVLGSVAGQLEADPDPAPLSFGQTINRLRLAIRDLAPENFPLEASSARSMAAAFLKLAREFVHPAWGPDARTACAPFLKAGAACLDGLLSELRSREAVSGRRVLGERDED